MRKPHATLCPTAAQAAWNETSRSAPTPTQKTVCCELITPMYGGGVTAGEVDRKMPIRASALRGQLRFWWRLLNGAKHPTSKELFSTECELWGGISSTGPKASQVTLQVKAVPGTPNNLISSRDPAGRNPIRRKFDYVLILEQGENPMLLDAGYEFELVLSFNSMVNQSQHDQVVEALRWWASFGGVGARTRRGLGAVEATSSDLALNPVDAKEVQSKGGRMVLKPSADTATNAWRAAVDALKDFRQGKSVGRSLWPEPDAIRRLARQHAQKLSPKHPVEKAFPRAAFGLPIVFHFKDHGDPPDYILEPDVPDVPASDRMASPLILRPYFDGTQYRPLALLLPGWEERVSVSVRFDKNSQGAAWPRDGTERSELAKQVSPIANQGTDALSAFMNYFNQ